MTTKKKPAYLTAATLNLRGVGKWDVKGRKAVADWLRLHADELVRVGDRYCDGNFCGRYLYPSRDAQTG